MWSAQGFGLNMFLFSVCCFVAQMVSAWKESGKLKDLKIEELNFQLGQAAAQLEATKQEAAALQQQLADSTSKVCRGASRCSYKSSAASMQLSASSGDSWTLH